MAQLQIPTDENYTRIPLDREKENLLEKVVTEKEDMQFSWWSG